MITSLFASRLPLDKVWYIIGVEIIAIDCPAFAALIYAVWALILKG